MKNVNVIKDEKNLKGRGYCCRLKEALKDLRNAMNDPWLNHGLGKKKKRDIRENWGEMNMDYILNNSIVAMLNILE